MGTEPDHDDPDVNYNVPVRYGVSQVRTEIGLVNGDVEWFLVQLEENLGEQFGIEKDWRQVARFDHHPNADWGHDITEERLHLDLYSDGRKVGVKRGFPPVALNNAPAVCQEYLLENAEKLLSSYGP